MKKNGQLEKEKFDCMFYKRLQTETFEKYFFYMNH